MLKNYCKKYFTVSGLVVFSPQYITNYTTPNLNFVEKDSRNTAFAGTPV